MGHDSIYSRSNGRWKLEPRACHWLRYLRHRYAGAGCLNAGKAIVRTAYFGSGRAVLNTPPILRWALLVPITNRATPSRRSLFR